MSKEHYSIGYVILLKDYGCGLSTNHNSYRWKDTYEEALKTALDCMHFTSFNRCEIREFKYYDEEPYVTCKILHTWECPCQPGLVKDEKIYMTRGECEAVMHLVNNVEDPERDINIRNLVSRITSNM